MCVCGGGGGGGEEWEVPIISKTRKPPNRYKIDLPAWVAQSDARPTGDQEVAGSTPAEVGNILSWRLIMKYFLRSFAPFR